MNKVYFSCILCFALLCGCVSQSDYDELLLENEDLKDEIEDLTDELEDANSKSDDNSDVYNYKMKNGDNVIVQIDEYKGQKSVDIFADCSNEEILFKVSVIALSCPESAGIPATFIGTVGNEKYYVIYTENHKYVVDDLDGIEIKALEEYEADFDKMIDGINGFYHKNGIDFDAGGYK